MERYTGISADDLAVFLEARRESLLLLDCRPFMAYNTRHIITASNVHCPPILKRRSGGFVSLENILPCETKRNQLLSGYFDKVVMYDSETNKLTKTSSPDSNIYAVMKSFNQQVQMDGVLYLKGGYKKFSQLHPHLCARPADAMEIEMRDSDVITMNIKRSRNKEDSPVEILPHLYLGDYCHAGKKDVLDQLRITALLNVSVKCKNNFTHDFLYKTIPVDDNSLADLASWFYEAIDFIDLVQENGGKVLLHCKAGISRSATICLAYLIFKKGYSLEEAYCYVQSRRNVIAPNLNFMRQLHDFEKELSASRSSVLTSSISTAAEISKTFTWPLSTVDITPVLASSISTATEISKTFTWPLSTVDITPAPPTDFLDYKYDYSPLNSPTRMVSSPS